MCKSQEVHLISKFGIFEIDSECGKLHQNLEQSFELLNLSYFNHDTI